MRNRLLLIIPLLFICVPVYERTSGTNGQDIVDADNAAAMWKWHDLTVIADHAYQGFSRLEKTKVGMTAWLGTKRYKCDLTELGRIQDSRLYCSTGEYAHKRFTSGLCIYTCHGRKIGRIQPVRLTHWEEVNG